MYTHMLLNTQAAVEEMIRSIFIEYLQEKLKLNKSYSDSLFQLAERNDFQAVLNDQILKEMAVKHDIDIHSEWKKFSKAKKNKLADHLSLLLDKKLGEKKLKQELQKIVYSL